MYCFLCGILLARSSYMKQALFTLLFALFSLGANLALAENIIYNPLDNNRYAVLDPETQEQIGVIQLKARNNVTFYYGKSVRLNGKYRVQATRDDNDVYVDEIIASLLDNEDTSMLIASAQLQIDFNHTDVDQLKNSTNVPVSIKIWVNGSENPRLMQVIIRNI